MSATDETYIIGQEQGWEWAESVFERTAADNYASLAGGIAWHDENGDPFSSPDEREAWVAGFRSGWSHFYAT